MAVSDIIHTVTVDGGFVLEIIITDYNLPIDSITWYRDGTLLVNNDQFTLTNSTDTLGNGSATLAAVSTSSLVDDGSYKVIVTNPAGSDMILFNITIQSESPVDYCVCVMYCTYVYTVCVLYTVLCIPLYTICVSCTTCVLYIVLCISIHLYCMYILVCACNVYHYDITLQL